MKPADLTLYTVLVFASPPGRWFRASQPIARREATAIVAEHWSKGRLARLRPPRVVGEAGEVRAFVPPPHSPLGRKRS